MAELGRLSAIAKRKRKLEREEAAQTAHLTFRQRLGLSLSKLSQEQLDVAIQKLANDALAGDTKAVHALARLADQSFGRAQIEAPADDRDADEKDWNELTPAEKSAYRAALIATVNGHEKPSGDADDPCGD